MLVRLGLRFRVSLFEIEFEIKGESCWDRIFRLGVNLGDFEIGI